MDKSPVAPSTFATNYPATENLVAMFGIHGITTGFGYFDDDTNPAMFASPEAFWPWLIDRGFYTGWNTRKYYTPMQALALYNLTFTLNTVEMNGIEYTMRREGVTVGNFDTSSLYHEPGEGPCDILAALATNGYTVGDVGASGEGGDDGLTDYECLDGRCYGTGCLAPYMNHVSGLGGTLTGFPMAEGNWAALPDKSFSFFFNTAINLLYFIYTYGNAAIRMSVDGVVVDTVGYSSGTNTMDMKFVRLDAGPHTVSFEYQSVYDNEDCHATFLAFKPTCTPD